MTRAGAVEDPDGISHDVIVEEAAEVVLCALCHRRRGLHPRWRGGSETTLVCAGCHAHALAGAAAWMPGGDTHIGVWACWAVGCMWSMSWSGSWVDVCGELARRLARDAMLEHAATVPDGQHEWIARDLRVQRHVLPSEIDEL